MISLPLKTTELIVVAIGNQYQLLEGFTFAHAPVAPTRSLIGYHRTL